MALIHCNINSQILGTSTSFYALLPEAHKITKKPGGLQILYLLHGIGDDHSKWVRRTPIERYVQDYELAVIMPQASKSFYTDMVYGNKYWTFISEELPKIVGTFFPISDNREDHFVAGLSMGGYGSFKLALNKPDYFAAAASFSGALDVEGLLRNENEFNHSQFDSLADAVFGGIDHIKGSINDLFCAAQNLKDSGEKVPNLYQTCGTEDPIYKYNVKFHQTAQKLGLDLKYEEWSGGHDWKFWDESIQKALNWFQLKRVE